MTNLTSAQRSNIKKKVMNRANGAHGGGCSKKDYNKPHPKSGYDPEGYRARRAAVDEEGTFAESLHQLRHNSKLATESTSGLHLRVLENKDIDPVEAFRAGWVEQYHSTAHLQSVNDNVIVHDAYEQNVQHITENVKDTVVNRELARGNLNQQVEIQRADIDEDVVDHRLNRRIQRQNLSHLNARNNQLIREDEIDYSLYRETSRSYHRRLVHDAEDARTNRQKEDELDRERRRVEHRATQRQLVAKHAHICAVELEDHKYGHTRAHEVLKAEMDNVRHRNKLRNQYELDRVIRNEQKWFQEVDGELVPSPYYREQLNNLRFENQYLRETVEERAYRAVQKFIENDLLENGPKKETKMPDTATVFEVYNIEENNKLGLIYPKTATNLPPVLRARLTLPLVPMLFFFHEARESWVRWIARQFLKPFYCHFTVQDIQQVEAQYLDTEHRMIWYPENATGTMLQCHSTGRHFDKTQTVSLLKNFRFLGFEWDVIRNIFLSENDFFVRHKLNRYNIQLVHPIIYQQALKTALGKTVTTVLVDQMLSDMKSWCDMVPSDIVVSSINCGCQMAQALMSVKNAAFTKVDIKAATA